MADVTDPIPAFRAPQTESDEDTTAPVPAADRTVEADAIDVSAPQPVAARELAREPVREPAREISRGPAREIAREPPREATPLRARPTSAEKPVEKPAASLAAPRVALGTSAAPAPPAVQRSIEIPGTIRWAAAALVDTTVSVGVAGGAVYAALTARGVRVAVQPVVDYVHADFVTGVATLAVPAFVALFALQLVTVVALGANVGQRIVGLRVLRLHDGKKPGIIRIVLRAIASAAGVVALGVGPFWALWLDGRRRGLGDIVARTVVARPPTAGGAA